MRGRYNETWVTSVVTEEQVSGALVLCHSIKSSMSNRLTTLILATKLSTCLLDLLFDTFDYVFQLESDPQNGSMSTEDYAKLSAFKVLSSFDKCVYLSSNMMVIKNCDQLFIDGNFTEEDFANEDNILSIFSFQPSVKIYKKLLEELQSGTSSNILGTKFVVSLNNYVLNIERGIGSREDFSVANFKENPLSINDVELGILEKVCHSRWISLYKTFVEPLLMSKILPEIPARWIDEPIAIVGMSCRYPNANNLSEFWNILIEGQDATNKPPSFRWLKEQCSRNRADCMETSAGFLPSPVDEFDGKFFGISPKEIIFMDPQHRLLHELVWEGLENAGINPTILRGTNASVFIGSWTNDYKDILLQSGNTDTFRTYMGNSIGAAAARISFMLGITGPSVATESGCSAGMVAVHLACQNLQLGTTNLALACGVNLLLHPFDKDEMPMVLSPDGKCKTFDAGANGFARAEGCGVLLLKRLSTAVKDGDHVWALIRGSGMSQEGLSKSMGTPTVEGESLAMKQALKNARVKPEDVSYVETHGTGTTVGDPMEVAAIADAYHSKVRKDKLIIGSVKTNVGHTESCSGITGIMKVVLAMEHQLIPPHRNFTSLNPAINLDAVPATIPLEAVNWEKRAKPRIGGVSSFGITGTDVHVILEERPTVPGVDLVIPEFEREIHIFKATAKTKEALDILMGRYEKYLNGTTEELKNVAFTGNVGRADFSHRAVMIGSSVKTLKMTQAEVKEGTLGKICFLFTGQGSQYPDMGKKLYLSSPVFQMNFDYCCKIMQDKFQIDIISALWGSNRDQLSRTIYSQTSIFCVEFALLKVWESWGLHPDYVLGHSLGEFAAAVAANLISVEDACTLVGQRSALIDKLPQGKMLVVRADKDTVSKAMNDFAGGNKTKILDFAALNSNQQTVVAGNSEVVTDFRNWCTRANVKCILLESTHAFHSCHMDPILKQYEQVANEVTQLAGNGCTYISGVKGTICSGNELNASYWVAHTREKVEFLKASQSAVAAGCTTFVEIGPQPVLSALTTMNTDTKVASLPSLKRKENEWTTMLTSLGKLYLLGASVNWQGVDKYYERKKVVDLPHYPFIGKKYWPNISIVNQPIVHPLIGKSIQNASSTKLFEAEFNLNTMEYVRDHVIGNQIVFPGAGFLEMMLAAGLTTTQGGNKAPVVPQQPIKIEGLSIDAPLQLQDGLTCHMQTVVGPKTEGNFSIEICHRQNADEVKWLQHSHANYYSVVPSDEKKVPFDPINIPKMVLKPTDELPNSGFYTHVQQTGLNFGPAFKTLDKLWWNDDGTLTAQIIVPAAEPNYIIHPVIVDAMIQSIMKMKHEEKVKKKLCIPLKIGKFIWLSNVSTSEAFIHVYDTGSTAKDDSSQTAAALVDANGKLVAIIESLEFVETTVKAVQAVLEQQKATMPDMWEEVWKPKMGPLQHPVNLIKCSGIGDQEMLQTLVDERLTMSFDGVKKQEEILGNVTYLCLLRGMYECGWMPQHNESFTLLQILTSLKIKQDFMGLVDKSLTLFETNGLLRKENKSWKVIASPPSHDLVVKQLSKLGQLYHSKGVKLFQRIGQHLAEILQGDKHVTSLLWPDASDEPTIEDYYEEHANTFKLDQIVKKVVTQRLKHIQECMTGQKFVVRILQLGSGNDTRYVKVILDCLDKLNIEYQFSYASTTANHAMAHKLENGKLGQVNFKRFNLEEDPLCQGFTPRYYDYVFCGDISHNFCTSKIIKCVSMLTKPIGKFDLVSTIRETGYSSILSELASVKNSTLELTLVTALEKRFRILGQIFTVFKTHTVLCTEHLEIVTESKNFGKTWILFETRFSPISEYLKLQLKSVDRRVVVVTTGGNYEQRCNTAYEVRSDAGQDFKQLLTSVAQDFGESLEGIGYCWALDKSKTKQEELLQPYFYLTKNLSLLSSNVRIVIFTNNSFVPVEPNNSSNHDASTIWGFTRSLLNENEALKCHCVDITDDENSESTKLEMFYELWNTEKDNDICYHQSTQYIRRFQRYKPVNTDLPLPLGTDRFQLILPETKAIQDLTFGPLAPFPLLGNEIEVQIKATALNFRDILSILKPSEQFSQINSVGLDFSGVVKSVGSSATKWSVGDPVFGVNFQGNALPSHVQLGAEDVLPLPPNMTFGEGATLPAVFMTAYHCLIDVAKICPNDIVLIHTASGGVGLCAIQICQYIGCTIVATAGSQRKQNYLKSLDVANVFYSRNTLFSRDIFELTGGRGVDVVLNSLTSDGFKEATLESCATGARFVEMSKLGIWSVAEVKRLRPDVKYSVEDLSSMDPTVIRRLMSTLKEFLEAGKIKPISHVRFDGVNIRAALEYMQKAKHIGKVVCVMPQLEQIAGQRTVYTPMFNDRSSYLITGGLGGIGLEVCKWMVGKGGKYIILGGRSPPTAHAQGVIDQMNANGACVTPMEMDVGSYPSCEKVINQLEQLGYPPMRGVMHAAGTLADGMIENQNWQKLSSTLKTKVEGTKNLDRVTKKMDLEHFVTFSSIAALFGPPGQSNHAAGNCFEDAFCHWRRSLGLPATTINWGLWGEVGVGKDVSLPGMKAISILQGIQGLEHVMKTQRAQTCVMNVESFALLTRFFPSVRHVLDERIVNWKNFSPKTLPGVGLGIKSEEFWKQYDAKSREDDKINVLKEVVARLLRSILKLDEKEVISEQGNLQELGVDSLMFIEIKNGLQSLFGERIVVNANTLRDADNVSSLATTLFKVIEGNNDKVHQTSEEIMKLLREDCQLPETIQVTAGQKAKNLEDINTVMMTGCTGNLGPYILKELSTLPQISEIICLIRPNSKLSLDQRLQTVLEDRQLTNQVDLSKVTCVAGNVAKPYLGMSQQIWATLSEKVDAIFHCAAYVQHMDHYKKSSGTNNIRAVNIFGVKNILEFSCKNNLKRVFYASALCTVATTNEHKRLSETWPNVGDFDGVTHLAYPNTKFVGDVLMAEGVKRGIPCKSFRFPFIGGDSISGRFVVDQNHVMLRYLFILKNGLMPSTPFPMMLLPVDVCARVAVQIFFDPSAPQSDIYNVTHNEPNTDQEFVHVAEKFGFSVDLVEFEEFAEKVRNKGGAEGYAMFKDFYDENVLEKSQSVPVIRQWLEGGVEEFWKSCKVDQLLPGFYTSLDKSNAYIERDLKYAQSQGWFQKFKICSK